MFAVHLNRMNPDLDLSDRAIQLMDHPADFVDERLVWAAHGQLRSARLGKGKLFGEKLLHDFNDMKFEAIAAPY